jgi:hypothetical protein
MYTTGSARAFTFMKQIQIALWSMPEPFTITLSYFWQHQPLQHQLS